MQPQQIQNEKKIQQELEECQYVVFIKAGAKIPRDLKNTIILTVNDNNEISATANWGNDREQTLNPEIIQSILTRSGNFDNIASQSNQDVDKIKLLAGQRDLPIRCGFENKDFIELVKSGCRPPIQKKQVAHEQQKSETKTAPLKLINTEEDGNNHLSYLKDEVSLLLSNIKSCELDFIKINNELIDVSANIEKIKKLNSDDLEIIAPLDQQELLRTLNKMKLTQDKANETLKKIKAIVDHARDVIANLNIGGNNFVYRSELERKLEEDKKSLPDMKVIEVAQEQMVKLQKTLDDTISNRENCEKHLTVKTEQLKQLDATLANLKQLQNQFENFKKEQLEAKGLRGVINRIGEWITNKFKNSSAKINSTLDEAEKKLKGINLVTTEVSAVKAMVDKIKNETKNVVEKAKESVGFKRKM